MTKKNKNMSVKRIVVVDGGNGGSIVMAEW